MNDEQQRHLVEAAKQLLDRATDNLDHATLARLQRARNQALAKKNARPSWLRRPLPLTGALGSALATAALVVFLVLHPSEQEAIEKNLVADLGIFTAEESVEFFEEIEFYEWLSTVDEPESRLSGTRGIVPGFDSRSLGQGQNGGSSRREAGDGNAGVSRII